MLLIDGTERERGASQIFLHREPFWLPVEPFAMLVYLAVGTATQEGPVSPPWGDNDYQRQLIFKLRARLPADAIDFLPGRKLGQPGGYRLNLTAREINFNHRQLAIHSDHRVRLIFGGTVPSIARVA